MNDLKGYMHGGFRDKYRIEKVNGKPLDPRSLYFVLRYDADGDPHALKALAYYAQSVKMDNPRLSGDLMAAVSGVNAVLAARAAEGGGDE